MRDASSDDRTQALPDGARRRSPDGVRCPLDEATLTAAPDDDYDDDEPVVVAAPVAPVVQAPPARTFGVAFRAPQSRRVLVTFRIEAVRPGQTAFHIVGPLAISHEGVPPPVVFRPLATFVIAVARSLVQSGAATDPATWDDAFQRTWARSRMARKLLVETTRPSL